MRHDAEITNSIGMKLEQIPAGEFMMGGTEPAEELVKAFAAYHRKPEFFKDEYPRHRVRITKPFYFGKYEVTVGQFRRFVEDAGYKTEAERDGTGGWGYNPTISGNRPAYGPCVMADVCLLCQLLKNTWPKWYWARSRPKVERELGSPVAVNNVSITPIHA